MPSKDNKIPLVILLGATAVGKTEISIEYAQAMNAEIVSADSRLFYRGMDIGTAKPTAEQLETVPHHMIDVVDPGETWSLAIFRRMADEAIVGIHKRGRLAILVGGTGQYMRAVAEGWGIPEVKPNLELRDTIEKWAAEIGPEGLHARLAAIDGEAAKKMDSRNLRRIVRALEVLFTTGSKFSDQRLSGESPYRILQFGLRRPREEIYLRIDERVDGMLSAGFVDEVRSLLADGYSPDLPSFSAIGYRQISDYVLDKVSLDEAVAEIKRLSRNYVRRQGNWFKEDDPRINWIEAEPESVKVMVELTRSFLQNEGDHL